MLLSKSFMTGSETNARTLNELRTSIKDEIEVPKIINGLVIFEKVTSEEDFQNAKKIFFINDNLGGAILLPQNTSCADIVTQNNNLNLILAKEVQK
jgi:hypothetical protein